MVLYSVAHAPSPDRGRSKREIETDSWGFNVEDPVKQSSSSSTSDQTTTARAVPGSEGTEDEETGRQTHEDLPQSPRPPQTDSGSGIQSTDQSDAPRPLGFPTGSPESVSESRESEGVYTPTGDLFPRSEPESSVGRQLDLAA